MFENKMETRSLFTLIAVALLSGLTAVLLVIALVLPTAYGIDPTGIGSKLGLVKAQPGQPENLARTETTTEPSGLSPRQASKASKPIVTDIDNGLEPEREDTVSLVVPPKSAMAYRITMLRDYALNYHWKTDDKRVNLTFRGEGKNIPLKIFKDFSKDHSAKGQGLFIVPFPGVYGWYWENQSDQPITIWLNARGAYQIFGVAPVNPDNL